MTTTTAATEKIPRVLWAQREDVIYVTIEIIEGKDEEVTITSDKLSFRALEADSNENVCVELPFFSKVICDESSWTMQRTDRHYFFTIKKEDTSAPYWPKLLNWAKKPHFVHTDFSKWKDEDEEEEETGVGMPGMSGMGGMGGGMEGMDMEKLMASMGGMDALKGMGGEDGGFGSSDDDEEEQEEVSGDGDNDTTADADEVSA